LGTGRKPDPACAQGDTGRKLSGRKPIGGGGRVVLPAHPYAKENDAFFRKVAPTNFVPAVAVKRRGPVLSVMTGRKARVGGHTGDLRSSFSFSAVGVVGAPSCVGV